jgi:RHH-type proline utilization regulon transcriptional repressor/proline dehydrogenase/delta 1-pyrroline-5-carboxylate dehydrogenase
MSDLAALRARLAQIRLAGDDAALAPLLAAHAPDAAARAAAVADGAALVRAIRTEADPGLMEVFLAEYGLSTEEGVALMCLAEALLRVPDADTIDALIEDKIAPSDWGAHLGKSASSLVNASTWALMLTGRVLHENAEPGISQILRGAVRRLGEPVIRVAVGRAMREMGRQFVLGETIEAAIRRAAAQEAKGYAYSYDMLGEAALTEADAQDFFDAYAGAIARLGEAAKTGDVRRNPGISIKLSALHPRYEESQRARVMAELVPRALDLARRAKAAGLGLNIDAEEADRLEISLDVIEALLRDPSLAGWDGFGVVVQAYGKRAGPALDWLHALAGELDRKLMVRLVKGAYWDTEIKRAQVEGLAGFPVFARKAATDVSYICCARKLLGMTDRIFPQFATHNAHSVAAILQEGAPKDAYEFQRLHGMGEALYEIVTKRHGAACRIYAPVGAHRDLLAYLVRRLLENGANSSFVNQIVDARVPPETVAADPFAAWEASGGAPAPGVVAPRALFAPERPNSAGIDLHDPAEIATLEAGRAPFRETRWTAAPMLAAPVDSQGAPVALVNPARPDDIVGAVREATQGEVDSALAAARPWDAPGATRGAVLRRAADLYEAAMPRFLAILAREAGKTCDDGVAEVREAVDFLRYYAAAAERLDAPPRGVIACVSPWNFPLAIFTGQIAGALAAGNGVLAKPAEATPLVAAEGAALLREAGVPETALQLLPGQGGTVGAALTGDRRVAGACFTGSTETARRIDRALAEGAAPDALLIAETGGLNAMIVDSTALPEQAVRDIVTSAFRSAGQRCSALRMLYLQEDIAEPFLEMLFGAMDALTLGDPWDLATDVGPVIDAAAREAIQAHVDAARAEGRLLKQLAVPAAGSFVGPAALSVGGIADLEREVFGPVLHVARFAAAEIDAVVDAVNASGYGLTFGMHSRIDDRVEAVSARLRVGNIYVNRNQIGAVVGAQPFGGEGLSGTGPKAGGPAYVPRMTRPERIARPAPDAPAADVEAVRQALAAARVDRCATLSAETLPGPTGESNRLTTHPRGVALCLGPDAESARRQAEIAREARCAAVAVAPGLAASEGVDGALDAAALTALEGFDLVACWAEDDRLCAVRRALAAREGRVILVSVGADLAALCRLERHLCIDTTAAGGNATLLARAA